jgi:hypothetical protein
VLIGAALACHGETVCPWLNSPTVAEALGGPVSVIVKPTYCDFTRDTHTSALHIEVQKKPASPSDKCEAKVPPLMAIGNGVVVCSISTFRSGAFMRRTVFARVRDQGFSISLQTSDPDLSTVDERIRKVAETIADTLY